MNLYRPKFKDRRTGQITECSRWYVDFRDHHGTRQRFAGDEDEHTAAEFGRNLVDLVRCRKRAIQPKDKLWIWIMGLPSDVQERLIELDLAERQWFNHLSQADRLSTWVGEYESWLCNSRGKRGYIRNRVYTGVALTRIRNILAGCSFSTWADIRKSAIENYLGGLLVKIGTYNGYVAAFKTFCTWCVKEGRAEFSPVQFLDRLSGPDKEKRQALSFDAVCRLLTAAVNGSRAEKISGMERGIIYRTAIETGYRVNELRNLTVASFDAKKATLSLGAEYCKDRRDAVQPITIALASRLADYLTGRDTTRPIFNLTTSMTARMIKTDAAAAGLPLVDDEGRELVFHSLRHTLRTELVRARVTESVIDRIMRHKPAGIGQRFYTHITDFEIREAIERLPDYPWPGDLTQSQAAKAVS